MHDRTRAALAVLLAPLLTLLVLAPAAQASPRSPDPERVVVPEAPRTTAGQKAPATIDSDVYAYTTSATFRNYFITAGHLTLSLKSGSSTKYAGSFVDYVGGKSTKASADVSDPTAPLVTFKGKNGSLTFKASPGFGTDFYSGKATKVPSKLGIKAGDVYLAGAKHALTTRTYSVVLTERSGPANRPFEYTGSLTIAYDANSRISGGQVTVTNRKGKNVTNALKNSGFFSSGSYFYTVATVDKLSMGLSATFSGSGFSGFGFSGSGSKTSQWLLSGTL